MGWLRPNASFQRHRWQASEPARLAARDDHKKSRPAQRPRQRRPLQSNVGRPVKDDWIISYYSLVVLLLNDN